MDTTRLLDDTAHATTAHIVDVFNLRDEERIEAFAEVYLRVRAGLEALLEFRRQEHERLYGPPGQN